MENLFKNPTKEQKDKINPLIDKFIQNNFNFNSFDNSTQNAKIALETGK